MEIMNTKTLMARASGKEKALKVFKNARLLNVYSKEIEKVDIAVEKATIIGIGTYEGEEEIDLNGAYVAPGFIDGHVHIESSMVTPEGFASLVMPHGTTTVIADPHEIANVAGEKGIRYMLECAKRTPLDIKMMLPSSVPSTTFETSGATMDSSSIKRMKDLEGVFGLGEVMNDPGVINGEKDIHEKIALMKGRPIDGHAPALKGLDLNAYILAGVMTDHECETPTALLERVKKGMYVHLREGSQTRNVTDLLSAVNKNILPRLLFCTDDKHPEDIKQEGHINYNVNLAIKHGLDPIDAVSMGTLNAANCYNLKDIGAIAPGKKADFIVFDSLKTIHPNAVYKNGERVAENKKMLKNVTSYHDESLENTVHIDKASLDFSLHLKQERVHVIGLNENNITTKNLIETVKINNGLYQNAPDDDIMKLAVVERHKASGNIGLGLVKGFGFKHGALAMSIGHDAHNVLVLGDSDETMTRATEEIIEMQGGIALAQRDGKVQSLQLEVGGLMTKAPHEDVEKTLSQMKQTLRIMGLNETIRDPFIQLAFLSLAVVPSLKLTDRGLFDVEAFKLIQIEAREGE